MKIKVIFLSIFFVVKLSASSSEIKGILFIPEVFNNMAEVDPIHNKILINVYNAPSTSSAVLATIARSGAVLTSGKSLYVPEFEYEERALPVLEQKESWYKVGFSNQIPEGFSEDYSVIGWMSHKPSRYQSIEDFLKTSLVSVIEWDQTLYTTPTLNEKFKVIFSKSNKLDQEPVKHDGVEILEFKKIAGKDWVRLKIKDHCAGEKIYGEGWLPLRQNKKINFSFSSRGC